MNDEWGERQLTANPKNMKCYHPYSSSGSHKSRLSELTSQDSISAKKRKKWNNSYTNMSG